MNPSASAASSPRDVGIPALLTLLVLTLFQPLPAAGQELPLLGVPAGQLGEPAADAEEEAPDPAIAPAPPDSRDEAGHAAFGRSGAIRVILVDPDEPLEPLGLTAGEAWAAGHRWIQQFAPGPRVLGEAAPYVSAPLETGEVRAPDVPGIWRLESAGGEAVTVITLVPAAEKRDGHLNGYHIGSYPAAAGNGPYAPPTGFVEVTPENQDLYLSEHLRLGQFLTKDQFDVWPKYVALDLRLIDKLELVMQELRAMGVRAEGLHVMSGFRTPQYNGPGGNGRAALSRHMYGDAADVWIDNSGDGWMDDLDGDGRVDIDDAALILRAVERVERRYPDLVGGAGTYPENAFRGPYIHIDVRGERSRW